MWWQHPRHIGRQPLGSLWYNLYTSPLLITVALARAWKSGCVEGQIQQALCMSKAEMSLQLARLLQSTGSGGHQLSQQDNNLLSSGKPGVPAWHLHGVQGLVSADKLLTGKKKLVWSELAPQSLTFCETNKCLSQGRLFWLGRGIGHWPGLLVLS